MAKIGQIIVNDNAKVQVGDFITNIGTIKQVATNEKGVPKPIHHKILFLSACPKTENDLRFTKELTAMKNAIDEARDFSTQLHFNLNTNLDSLQFEIFQKNPDILHISVHGDSEQGLLFVDDKNDATPLDKVTILQITEEILKKNDCRLKVIVFSACNSADFAEIVPDRIKAIGMNGFIPIDASNLFTYHLYKIILSSGDILAPLNMAVNNAKRAIERRGFRPQSGVNVHEMPVLFNL